jgi:hypothetical protein
MMEEGRRFYVRIGYLRVAQRGKGNYVILPGAEEAMSGISLIAKPTNRKEQAL